ncbi:MAG: protein kinase [Chthoniobacter sp.]
MHCPTCGAAMRVRRKFDHFDIQEELGAGGMGTVYRALDVNLSRPVALKLLQREHGGNPQFVAQFQKEASITASINHPHVVKVYSTGRTMGCSTSPWNWWTGFAGELDGGGWTPAEVQVLSVGIQIAQGLQAALEKGLIHRDIKPGTSLRRCEYTEDRGFRPRRAPGTRGPRGGRSVGHALLRLAGDGAGQAGGFSAAICIRWARPFTMPWRASRHMRWKRIRWAPWPMRRKRR